MSNKNKTKLIEIHYEPLPVTQEQLDDIFNFVFNKIAEYETIDNSKQLSNTYNSLGDKTNE